MADATDPDYYDYYDFQNPFDCAFNCTVPYDTFMNDSLLANDYVFATPYPLWLTSFLGILALIVSVVTVIGNAVVLLGFSFERSIRQPANYFIASLAVSGLLIGLFSMPLFTLYLLLGYWPLGSWLCDIWLSLDWTICLSSQYTVFFITLDRFLSVKISEKYRKCRTGRKVMVMVAITWVIPTLAMFTSIIGWQLFYGNRGEYECYVQFLSDPLFTFLLTIGYYWTTLIVMCGLYAGICMAAQNRSYQAAFEVGVMKGCEHIDAVSLKSLTSSENIKLTEEVHSDPVRDESGGFSSPVWKKRMSIPSIVEEPPSGGSGGYARCNTIEPNPPTCRTPRDSRPPSSTENIDADHAKQPPSKKPTEYLLEVKDEHRVPPQRVESPLRQWVKSIRKRNSNRSDIVLQNKSKSENLARKALRTITFILGAFVLCWTPYHIMVFIMALCGYGCVNIYFYNFTYWLYYINSPINPFCYAFANVQFKRAFIRVLKFDWHRT